MTPTPGSEIREKFMQGLGRVAEFWGFPKAMGAAYAAIYLSPVALSLDELVDVVGVTKGALSIHMRGLERMGVVHRDGRAGDRKDYYSADTDFWGVLRRILREREKREFDRALRSVAECLTLLDALPKKSADAALIAFWRERLLIMQRFFDALDRIIGSVLAMERFRQSALDLLLGVSNKTERKASR
jgi:DNA-binding transcriptional regulator GbsR (MarR family)